MKLAIAEAIAFSCSTAAPRIEAIVIWNSA
jgi:hypothetical protein